VNSGFGFGLGKGFRVQTWKGSGERLALGELFDLFWIDLSFLRFKLYGLGGRDQEHAQTNGFIKAFKHFSN